MTFYKEHACPPRRKTRKEGRQLVDAAGIFLRSRKKITAIFSLFPHSVLSVNSSEIGERVRDFRRSFAFTLVELMVVVAIMAMLLMILLPNLQRTREQARSASCQNNLRQYGIAMGRYMSDWKGYFIFPGDQAGGVPVGSYAGYDTDRFKAGVQRASSGIATSQAQSWGADFIAKYIPETITLESLSAGKPSVRVCPSVLQELRSYGNYFDPNSPKFKGYRTDWSEEYGVNIDYADFESDGGYDETTQKLILASYFTTYAINNYSGVYATDRTNISANTIAFIDWNAKEGWGGVIYYSPNTWQFTSLDGKIEKDTPKWSSSWWLTEVGFHHQGEGTNKYANYVAMDGHVSSVSSSQINSNYFMPTGP